MSARLATVLIAIALATAGCGDPLADLDYKGPVVVKGSVSVSPGLSCKAGDPLYDCRGLLLFVGIIDRPEPLPQSTLVASGRVPTVDLNGGKQVAYEVAGVPAGGYYISAMLAKSATLTDPPYPQTGDLATAPQPLTIESGVVTVKDIVLDIRWK
jgi:hypothetical protein